MGAQVVFSSIFLAWKDSERNRKTHLINMCLTTWFHHINLVYFLFYHVAVYLSPGLLATDGVHLGLKGKRILAQELSGLLIEH